MKKAIILTQCLLALCLGSSFGQAIEVALPTGLVANQASSVSVGADRETYIFVAGKGGNGTIYQVGAKKTTPVTGYVLSVPSPQGPDNLLGVIWNNMVTTLQVVDGVVKPYCSTYTLDGKTSALPNHLPYGPFPSYDGTYLYAGSDVVGTSTSSTLFQLTSHVGTTCDLHKVVSGINGETMRAEKQSSNKFTVWSMVGIDGGNNALMEVGVMELNGSYTSLIGASGSQIAAHRCCTFAPEWGTSRTFVAYTSADNKSVGVIVDEKGITEVFNSSATGNLTVDMWINDFRGDVAVLGGSNRTVGAIDELVAFNIATKVLTVVGSYNVDNLPGIKPLFFFRGGNASVDKNGTIWFEAYQISDKSNHLYQRLAPEPPTIKSFSADQTTIAPGDSTAISWRVVGASTLTPTPVSINGLGIPGGLGLFPASGSIQVSPAQTTTYFLTATTVDGKILKSQTTVEVAARVLLPTITGVFNSASSDKVLAPWMLASVFGSDFCYQAAAPSNVLPLPTTMCGGTQVLVNGTQVPLLYTSNTQINFLVPNISLGNGIVKVVRGTVLGPPTTFVFTATAPGVFQNGSLGILTDAKTGQLVTADTPMVPSRYYSIWATGLGAKQASCTPATGEAPHQACRALASVTLTIGGVPAEIPYAGAQSDYPGLDQINFLAPENSSSSQDVLGELTVGDVKTSFPTVLRK